VVAVAGGKVTVNVLLVDEKGPPKFKTATALLAFVEL
jgi:hypothetical protein